MGFEPEIFELPNRQLQRRNNMVCQVGLHQGTRPSLQVSLGGGPRVVVSTAAFHARVRGSVPGLGGLKETENLFSPSTCESQYCGEPP